MAISYAFGYSGVSNGSYRVLLANLANRKSHLCIHPTNKGIGFYNGSLFTPFGYTIQDNEVIKIVLNMNNGIFGLFINSKQIAKNIPGFSETLFPVTRIGNMEPSSMAISGGLAPSKTLAPSSHLAPSAAVISPTSHCNGFIDELQILSYELDIKEVRSLGMVPFLNKSYDLSRYKIDSAGTDGIITQAEKPALKNQWDLINGDGATTGSYWTAIAKANLLSITTEKDALASKYTALSAYMSANPGVLAIATWNADIIVSNTTPSWTSVWAEYYGAEIALSSAIAAKEAANARIAAEATAATLATAAQSSAQSFASGLNSSMQTQVDAKIECWYQPAASNPESNWTTDALKQSHDKDQWFKTDVKQWYRYRYISTDTGTWDYLQDSDALTAITNAATAQGTANTATTIANTKNTIFPTLAAANASAVVGDMFIDASILYRATQAGAAITLANSTRITPKRYADVANDAAKTTLTGMIANDTVYQTDKMQWFYYGVAWVADGISPIDAIPAYTPKFLDCLAAAPASKNKGDWFFFTGTTDTTFTNNTMYAWNGTSWVMDEDPDHTARAFTSLLALAATASKTISIVSNIIANFIGVNKLKANNIDVDDLHVKHLDGADGEFAGTLFGASGKVRIDAESAIDGGTSEWDDGIKLGFASIRNPTNGQHAMVLNMTTENIGQIGIGVWDEDHQYWYALTPIIQLRKDTGELIFGGSGAFRKDTDGVTDLGAASYRWRKLYSREIDLDYVSSLIKGRHSSVQNGHGTDIIAADIDADSLYLVNGVSAATIGARNWLYIPAAAGGQALLRFYNGTQRLQYSLDNGNQWININTGL